MRTNQFKADHQPEPVVGTMHDFAGILRHSEFAFDYPMGASCKGCGLPITKPASGTPWQHHERLGDHDTAIIVTVPKEGGPEVKRALWRVSIADAQKICNDGRSLRPRSMLVWYASASLPRDQYGITWKYATDNGMWDNLLGELGVQVLESLARPQEVSTP